MVRDCLLYTSLADAVAAHLHIGDGLLRRFADFLCLLVLFLLQDQLVLFLGGEKIAVHLAVFCKPLRLCGLFRAAVQSAIPDVYKRQDKLSSQWP